MRGKTSYLPIMCKASTPDFSIDCGCKDSTRCDFRLLDAEAASPVKNGSGFLELYQHRQPEQESQGLATRKSVDD